MWLVIELVLWNQVNSTLYLNYTMKHCAEIVSCTSIHLTLILSIVCHCVQIILCMICGVVCDKTVNLMHAYEKYMQTTKKHSMYRSLHGVIFRGVLKFKHLNNKNNHWQHSNRFSTGTLTLTRKMWHNTFVMMSGKFWIGFFQWK